MRKIITGKVRDVYEISERELVIVTTDRISAFDVILKSAIGGKGIALNLLSLYWFANTRELVPNHILSDSLSDMPAFFSQDPGQFDKRTVLVRKLRMLPYEFIVRGYMFGSLWEEYKASGSFCGQRISEHYELAQKLVRPVFTPSAKSGSGHDENISMDRLKRELGTGTANAICDLCLRLYNTCYEQALQKGIIIADTKFEFGYDEYGRRRLGDEIFTPDSSRFWSLADYRTGISPKSYDKQFVRDWLLAHRLNGVTPAPELPEEIIRITAGLYRQCYQMITGKTAY